MSNISAATTARSTVAAIMVVLVLGATGCSPQEPANQVNADPVPAESIADRNKEITRTFFQKVMNEGDLGLIDSIFADDYTLQGKPFPAEDTKRWAGWLKAIFPKGKFTLNTLVADGDEVAVWWTLETESLQAPQASYSGINILSFNADGRVTSNWEGDLSGSVIPVPPPYFEGSTLPVAEEAFRSNNGQMPPEAPAKPFVLRHDYPKELPALGDEPWNQVTAWPVTDDNVVPYMLALRDHAYAALRPVDWRVEDIKTDENGAGGWYHAPWNSGIYGTDKMGDGIPTWCGRDAFRGLYFGTPLPRGTIPGQTIQSSNYEVVYYNDIGGYHLGRVWNEDGTPDMANLLAPDGLMIVKLVFTPITNESGPLEGSPQWKAFLPTEPQCFAPAVQQVTLIQMDVVLKDSVRSPDTGWIFTTYVYDKDDPSEDPWDRMTPLGAQWGDDPGVWPGGKLKETALNPNMPAWFRLNLGYGGRLSGPIDGARNTGSCLSCHASSEFSEQPNAMLLSHMIPPGNSTIEELMDHYFANLMGDVAWTVANKALAGPLDPPITNVYALDYSFVTLNGLAHYHSVAGNDPAPNALNQRERF